MQKNGQSAIEFIALIAAIMFSVTGILIVLQSNIADKTRERVNVEFQDIARDIQREIDLASGASDGYRREFSVPEKISGLGFTLNLSDSLIYLKSDDEKHALALPVNNVTGQVVKGVNVVRKIDGQVFLNTPE